MLTDFTSLSSIDSRVRGRLESLSIRLEQFWRNLRRGGFARLRNRLLRLAQIPGIVNLVILGCVDPALFDIDDKDSLPGYVFAEAYPREADELAACSTGDPESRARLQELFSQFFASGHRCVVARQDDRIIGHLWAFTNEYTITTDDYHLTRLPVTLDADSVFSGNAFVAQGHRNRGVFRQLKLYLMGKYPTGTHFYTWVDELNNASLAVNRALGFAPLAKLRVAIATPKPRVELRQEGSDAWTDIAPDTRLSIAGMHIVIDNPKRNAVRRIS